MANKEAVWKFPLTKTGINEIQMPLGAYVLTAQLQGDVPCIVQKGVFVYHIYEVY